MRASATTVILLMLAALACTTARETPRRDPGRERTVVPAAEAPAQSAAAWANTRELDSALGTYKIRWRPSLDPVVEAETFAIDAWVFDARDLERPLADVELDVDAGMPQHGHGMAAYARLARRADGGWRAEGLRFHMLGRWELTFDVARGARTERAQTGIEIE